MFGKSVRFQFVMMGILYLLFASIIIFQMFYVYKREISELKNLRRTNDNVSTFLHLEDEERADLLAIRSFIANGVPPESRARLEQLDLDIVKWFSKLELWKEKMKSLEVSGENSLIENTVFSSGFILNKKRQANAYRKAVQCCRDGKFSEAQHVLNIEARYQPSIHDTVVLISQKEEASLENHLMTLRQFFFIMTVGCLLALALLVVTGTGIYRNLIGSINKIDIAIKRISSGNFNSTVKITSPAELSFLANSFNNMQSTIKLRDGKIHEDAEDIKKINEFLEQKVISCNRTIEQQDLALKRKNEEIESTLLMMAEELHNRLTEATEVSPALDDANIAPTPAEQLQDQVRKLSHSMKRLMSMSQQLNQLSAIGRDAMHIQHLPMAAVLRNISEHLKFHLGMAGAKLVISDNLVDCQGDGNMIEQAFIKLIENALHFRSPDRDPVIEVDSEMDILFVRYRIADNGIGIPRDFCDKIFQAFFKINADDNEGEGLGLAIVSRIVALHNGRVWVESTPGQGSTFIIELPKQQRVSI